MAARVLVPQVTIAVGAAVAVDAAPGAVADRVEGLQAPLMKLKRLARYARAFSFVPIWEEVAGLGAESLRRNPKVGLD
jgi:hypothetical protein